MKTSHIFWGTLFIILGLLVLINNLTPINFNWGNLWQYWPIILVLFGIAMMVRNKIGKGLLAGLAAIFLAVILFTSVKLSSNFIEGDFHIIFDDDNDSNYTVTEYTESIAPAIKYAVFTLDAGVGIFKLKSTTDDLIYVSAKGIKDNYKLINTESDSISDVKLKMKDTKLHFGKNDLTNKVDISLNENPVWDLDVNVGAAEIDLDLKRFKIENVDIEMGAASLDIKLGDLYESTKMVIHAGASEIYIQVPKKVGCQVKLDDVLSSKNIKRFERINSDLYQTANFDDAEKKIYIEIDCGVSSIKVRRY